MRARLTALAPARLTVLALSRLTVLALSRLTVRALLPVLLLGACGTGATGSPGDKIRVVAAENFWGSIAAQLAGDRGTVESIVVNPAEDPHSYEPSSADARTLATAQLVIVNGVGYDPWAPRLLASNPTPGRTVLTVGELLGLKEGENPHRWYDPANVNAVANAITAALAKLEPKQAPYFHTQLARFDSQRLATYQRLIATITRRYAGTAVGASESIFAMLAPTLGLKLITPQGFMDAVSEGTEVSAQDVIAAQQQIASHRIKVWIYNSQNATPEVQHLSTLARTARIPVVTITETLDPSNASFEQWQVGQLQQLEHALQAASER